jgi:hypothetical protein
MRAALPTLLWSLLLLAPARAEEVSFRLIIHPANPAAVVDRRMVADVFLKKISRWPDGEPVRPVDLPPDSAVRQRFSLGVLSRSASAVRHYWQQAIFSGRGLPPPELAGDEQVIRYVLNHRGAVGYISTQTELGGAKELTLK